MTKNFPWLSTTPLVYQVPLLVATHSFTNSKVQPIGPDGLDVTPPGRAAGEQDLPPSTIYGFNGKFPGGMINAEYGRPVIVRFENHLDVLPAGMTDADRQDFGSPNHAFLTHLHNGHTGRESDGNPHYTHHRFGPLGREDHEAAYQPGEWVDNLYLNYPAGGDDSEKQSFLWFHDHVHGHTGADVYKGMVGLFPIYDPYGGKDMGDETKGLRLPGRRTNNGDGSFDVEYDIPLAFYDVRLDDGVTLHQDVHNPDPNGEVRPEWWGKTFFQHFPNHGFVGDIFTVNGTAYPVLRVKRRNYRLRFLGASVSRIYDFQLMRSPGGPVASRTTGRTGVDLQGQYQLPDGVQCMQFTQIASEGGLLPHPIVRNSFEIWPAVRREVVVDFKHYQDGSETQNGDVIYLVNTMQMPDGRMWLAPGDPGFDPTYRVPVLKIIIDGDADDQSVMPVPGHPLREAPETKLAPAALAALTASATTAKNGRHFTLSRDGSGGLDGETEWLINGLPFVATAPLQTQTRGDATVWVIQNGGGGWVHPMHLHMEEHRVLERDNTPAPDGRHPDDTGKMDVVSLDPAETVPIYRSSRSFTGPYVAHCHNLAHEDHNMMFGWEIIPADGDAAPGPVSRCDRQPGPRRREPQRRRDPGPGARGARRRRVGHHQEAQDCRDAERQGHAQQRPPDRALQGVRQPPQGFAAAHHPRQARRQDRPGEAPVDPQGARDHRHRSEALPQGPPRGGRCPRRRHDGPEAHHARVVRRANAPLLRAGRMCAPARSASRPTRSSSSRSPRARRRQAWLEATSERARRRPRSSPPRRCWRTLGLAIEPQPFSPVLQSRVRGRAPRTGDPPGVRVVPVAGRRRRRHRADLLRGVVSDGPGRRTARARRYRAAASGRVTPAYGGRRAGDASPNDVASTRGAVSRERPLRRNHCPGSSVFTRASGGRDRMIACPRSGRLMATLNQAPTRVATHRSYSPMRKLVPALRPRRAVRCRPRHPRSRFFVATQPRHRPAS